MRKLFMLCTFLMMLVSGIIMSGCGSTKNDPLVGTWIHLPEQGEFLMGTKFIYEVVIEKKADKEYLYTSSIYSFQNKDSKKAYLFENKIVPLKTPLKFDPNNANTVRTADNSIAYSYDEKNKKLMAVTAQGTFYYVKKTDSEFAKMVYAMKESYGKRLNGKKISYSGPNPNLAAASVDKPVIDSSVVDFKGLTWKMNVDEFKKKYPEFKDDLRGDGVKRADSIYHNRKDWNKNYRIDMLTNKDTVKDKKTVSVEFRNGQLQLIRKCLVPLPKYDKSKKYTEIQASNEEAKKAFDEIEQKITKVYGVPYRIRRGKSVEIEKFGSTIYETAWNTNVVHIRLSMVYLKSIGASVYLEIINNVVQDHVNMENGDSGARDQRW